MRIYVTTSDNYHHILPVFFYLYGKYWADPMTLICYKKPDNLPDYCEWVSLGEQGTKFDFAADMRRTFKDQTEPFVWMMEDTFIRQPINRNGFELCKHNASFSLVGRVSLTDNSYKYYTTWNPLTNYYQTPPDSDYRLSLQPAIWNPKYLNKHLKDGMSPWMFENQNGTLMTFEEKEFLNVKLEDSPLTSNEGVRRFDLHRYDFTGLVEEDIINLKKMGFKHNPWTR